MKKLISVFAALALVGSLAAQKGKKPAAKAPAKPAVAAPAIPAMPAAVSAATGAAGAAKGMGLFIDLRGSYTFSNGTSDAKADGTTQADTTATVTTYKTSATQGLGGGASIGYDITSGLGLVASYDVRIMKSREYKGVPSNYSTSVPLTTADAVSQVKFTNMVIGLGLRPHVNALGGEVFGGAGVAFVLPFDYTSTMTISNATAGFNTATNSLTKAEIVTKYNLGIGAYGEVGYKFFFTDNIGLTIGLRAVVATVDNKDQTAVTTKTGTTTTTETTTFKESFSTDQKTAEGNSGTAAATKTLASYQTFGVTDFSANVGIALKF